MPASSLIFQEISQIAWFCRAGAGDELPAGHPWFGRRVGDRPAHPIGTECLLGHTRDVLAPGIGRWMLNGLVSSSSVVGRVGTVCVAVRGGELPGEVRVVVQGLPHYFLAYAKTPIAKDTQVLVINNRGSRQLDVEPWAHHDFGAAEVTGPDERF